MSLSFHNDLQIYTSLIAAINDGVRSFNSLLADASKLSLFDPADTTSVSAIGNTPWDDQLWPHTTLPGIYLLLAHAETDPSRLAVYVGKSSLSNMGGRMWSHLYKHRSSDAFRMHDLHGEPFIIDFLMALPIHDSQAAPLASAAEEFVIRAVSHQLHLLNGTGNRRRRVTECPSPPA